MDSHLDLGINAPPEHRIKYRRVTTCAPIHAKRWTQVTGTTADDAVVYIYAGPVLLANYTFSYIYRSSSDGFSYTLR
jgi:hypothetical protein